MWQGATWEGATWEGAGLGLKRRRAVVRANTTARACAVPCNAMIR